MGTTNNEQLLIPKKIKVGFQERTDTYTKRLGYVIYQDDKAVWRKEKSWTGWIDKGVPHGTTTFSHWDKDAEGKSIRVDKDVPYREPLPIFEHDNVPTEGFVLNKDAGGRKGSWSSHNIREPKVRVYDPRDFEIEISIPNLLFILQENNSIKGKGLEGKFIYSWSGTELVLLPCSSDEYLKSQDFTELQKQKIAAIDLVEGAMYKTKTEQEYIYLGKHTFVANYKNRADKGWVFYYEPIYHGTKYEGTFILLKDLKTLGVALTTEAVDNYPELYQKFIESKNYGQFDSYEEIQKKFSHVPDSPSKRNANSDTYSERFLRKIDKNKYEVWHVSESWEREYRETNTYKFNGYHVSMNKMLIMGKGTYSMKDHPSPIQTNSYSYSYRSQIDCKSLEFMQVQPFVNLELKTANGTKKLLEI